MPGHCAHPSARSCAQRPCPWRGTARTRPPDPLSLRADVLDDVQTCSSSIESATSTRKMVGRAAKKLRQTHGIKSKRHTDLPRAQVQAGLELRNWGVYAPFLSTMVTFESMVTAARRTALPHQLWEVQRDCLQSARLAYSNPPGSCSPPRQADDLCADHLRPQVVGAVRRPALASSRWMGRGRGTAHLSPP